MSRSWLFLFQVCTVLTRISAWSPHPPFYEIADSDGKKQTSLYPADGPVVPLWGSEGRDTIEKDDSKIWIVEYYHITCPHCWYFSGIYPTFARAVKSPTVMIGAFECVTDVNKKVCEEASEQVERSGHNFTVPIVLVYNAQKPGDAPRILHVHENGDIDRPLPAEDLAKNVAELTDGGVKVLNSQVFKSGAGLDESGSLVKIDGPPGNSGWPDEGWGNIQYRFHDAHIGMFRLLTDGYVNSKKYEAAMNVIKFVKRAFGKSEAQAFDNLLSKLTSRTARRLQANATSTPLHAHEFNIVMTDWAQQFNTTSLFCKTKTCTVWQLFHGIAALIHIGFADITVKEALPEFRYMVSQFLDCEVCKQHFVRSYDQCLFGRCEVLDGTNEATRSKALVMWLWRTHNAVNERVIKEKPAHRPIDRRWPSYKDCPGCWKLSVVQTGGPADELKYKGQQNDDQPVYDVFNEDEVFNYILLTYVNQTDAKKIRLDEVFPMVHMSRNGQIVAVFSSIAMAAVVFMGFLVVRKSSKTQLVSIQTNEDLLQEQELIAPRQGNVGSGLL
jgi:hypothetical protein